MKSYDETISTVSNRIEAYKAVCNQRKTVILRTVTPLFCICILGAAAFGIIQATKKPNLPNEIVEDTIYPGVKDTFDISKNEDPNTPAVNHKIVINFVDKIPETYNGIALIREHFKSMTQDELNNYYGMNVIPDIPDDLSARERDIHGIFQRNDGEIYWDQNEYYFTNETVTRSIRLTVNKDLLPFYDFKVPTTEYAHSIINNIEVVIMQTSDGWYYVEFLHKNVGFSIGTDGITQDELISIIDSIVQR